MKTKNLLFIIAVSSLMGCVNKDATEGDVVKLPYYEDASFTPHWLEENDPQMASFHQIEPFRLINQDGDTITNKDFANKIYVADFFFTICPGICPKMTKNMAVLQEAFREDPDVLLLSHSVTPEMDSVPVLQNYAKQKGVLSGKWHLVTGKRSDIYHLGRQAYFIEEDLGILKKPEEFLHTENFVLVDQNRHIRGIYNGLNTTSVQQLIADIHTLKNTM